MLGPRLGRRSQPEGRLGDTTLHLVGEHATVLDLDDETLSLRKQMMGHETEEMRLLDTFS